MFGIESGLSASMAIICLTCIIAVCAFEFVNGFHDTANAVATVIYTRSLKPIPAVIWSGIMNFFGVIMSSYLFGMAVATKIAEILPLDTVLSKNINEAVAMVISALLAAIIWNLATWYFGIPCSSSHTMIGSLLGVGIAFSMLPGETKVGVNWNEAYKIGNSLLISPLFGFSMAIAIMFLFRNIIKNKQIFKEPEADSTPPWWIRLILFTTCTLVSFFHGSNDGQKGIGLMMVVLLAFMPTQFAMAPDFDKDKMVLTLVELENALINESIANHEMEHTLCIKAEQVNAFANYLNYINYADGKQVMKARKQMAVLAKELKGLLIVPNLVTTEDCKSSLKSTTSMMVQSISHIPYWSIFLISLSLGIGTMIGWKRIVITIGEKIGKRHMTFAEGASAELVASSTIGLASGLGLPVSTTHVLSSGVAGAMVASKGIKNLQSSTIKNIALAWVLTLPVTIILSGGLYVLIRIFF